MTNKPETAGLNDIERELIEGMEGFLTDLKNDENIPEKYTSRTVVLELEPTVYSAETVKAVRQLLRVSQTLFAHFLGVSPKTVRAWETGQAPSDIARRFMDEIQRNPDYWRVRLQQSVRVRTP